MTGYKKFIVETLIKTYLLFCIIVTDLHLSSNLTFILNIMIFIKEASETRSDYTVIYRDTERYTKIYSYTQRHTEVYRCIQRKEIEEKEI